MPGAVASVGVLACAATLTVGLAVAGSAAAISQHAAGAADAAALAAADSASGAVPGDPCANAALVASANGAALVDCRVDGLVATVTVSVPFGAFSASARARAGPPDGLGGASGR